MSSTTLFAELRRRNVIRMAGLYFVGAWLIIQVVSTLLPAFDAPPWVLRVIVMLLAIGFVPTLAFGWIYEITPEGIKRESEIERHESITPQTGRRMDRAIIVVLALALVVFATDRFVLAPRREAKAVSDAVGQARIAGGSGAANTPSAPAGALPGVSISEQSIAVLPFVNMSSDKEQDYFSDGLSEELLNLLAKIPQLHVAARTSSFSFKGKPVEVPEIARQLFVAHVLEGSVRKSGDQVRITAQLIHAADGYHVWSQTWDRKLDDIFKIQDEIAGDVVKELKVSLLGDTPKTRATDPQAYALYLQAVEVARQLTPEAFAKSNALLQQALAIEPRYAPAWSELARNASNEMTTEGHADRASIARARGYAEKALAIDPDYALAHASLGFVTMTFDNDFASAAGHFDRALALEPTNSDVLRNAASLLVILGRLDAGLAIEETLARRDPVNTTLFFNMAVDQINAGHSDAAIRSLHTVLNLVPNRTQGHLQLGIALLSKGEAQAALAEMQQESSEAWRLIGLPMAYHALGREADSDKALAELIAKNEKDAPYNIAYIYAFRGQADKAFEWLDKAVAYQDPGLTSIATEKEFDNVRKDPRWLPFLRKVGCAPEQLDKIEFKVTLPKEWQAETTGAAATAAPPSIAPASAGTSSKP